MKKERIISYLKGFLCPPLYMDRKVVQISYIKKKLFLEQQILHSTTKGITSHKYCDHDIVVSLTTYGKRLYEVHQTIASLMEQTLKPNHIVLWLDKFYENLRLPESLNLLSKRGLDIRFCKDIGPYTKLIPSLREFEDAAIITVDDDLIYDFDVLERLIVSHIQHPNIIFANRVHRIIMKNASHAMPYNKWAWSYKGMDIHPNNFPTGVGGILYPPHCFDEEVFNESVFTDICKHADDIWFKAMALKNNIQSQKVFTHSDLGEDYFVNDNVQDCALKILNVSGKSLNDSQFDAVFKKYDLYKKLMV